MNAFLAVLIDTIHDSTRRVATWVIALIMVAVVLAGALLPGSIQTEAGEQRMVVLGVDEPISEMQFAWFAEVTAQVRPTDPDAPAANSLENHRWMRETSARLREQYPLSDYEREVQVWTMGLIRLLVKATMIGFIAIAATFVPRLMAAGSVDAVVSKPAGRLPIYLGKFAGGLVLIAVMFAASLVALYLGIGWKLGMWMHGVFMAIPLAIFIATVLYSILGFVGAVTRSSVVAMLVGYGYYLVIDTGIAIAAQVTDAGIIASDTRLGVATTLMPKVLPNFSLLNDATGYVVMTGLHVDPYQIWLGVAWIAITTTGGYVAFRIRDL